MSLYVEPEYCGYCYEADDGSKAVQLKCGHSFHRGCISTWYRMTVNLDEPACPPCANEGDPKHQFCHCHFTIQELKDGYELECDCVYHISCLKKMLELNVLLCQRCHCKIVAMDTDELDKFCVETKIYYAETE